MKNNYKSWKAAFSVCINQAPAAAECKLLQLSQYFSVELLKTNENLRSFAAAYRIAKEILERNFGGQRQQMAIYFEELENLTPVK